jgi:hypothetical protein
MTRNAAGACLAALVLAAATLAPAHAAVDRPQLIEAMKSNCYSTHADAAPSEKGKCECFARAFVESLTPGEIAVPKQSAAIQAKLAAARHVCHFGE